MEYMYAAMLLHSAKKPITEEAVTAILAAAGVAADGVRIKALVAALAEVNIDEALKAPVFAAAAAPAAAPAEARRRRRQPPSQRLKRRRKRTSRVWAPSSVNLTTFNFLTLFNFQSSLHFTITQIGV